MKKVYKYTEPIDDIVFFTIPAGADILKVDVQTDENKLCLWALVRPSEKTFVKRSIRIAGTGHPIMTEELVHIKYINTFTMRNRALWFHAFEIIAKKGA